MPQRRSEAERFQIYVTWVTCLNHVQSRGVFHFTLPCSSVIVVYRPDAGETPQSHVCKTSGAVALIAVAACLASRFQMRPNPP